MVLLLARSASATMAKDDDGAVGGAVPRTSLGFDEMGCVQSTHFGLRIGSYWVRIAPDSVCFRSFPVFARSGMQFESHLGHVFSLFRGL
jgi:hypothetical protein